MENKKVLDEMVDLEYIDCAKGDGLGLFEYLLDLVRKDVESNINK